MATNWRLTKKDIAHIAFALEQLEDKKLPKEIYGEEKFTTDELHSLIERFRLAAISTTHRTSKEKV